jgi:hypothetical protein
MLDMRMKPVRSLYRERRDLIGVTAVIPTLAIPTLRAHNGAHVILTRERDEMRRLGCRDGCGVDLLRQQRQL